MGQLLVGISHADITPPIGIAHAGWGAQTHERAAGIDFPMRTTAMWMSDGHRSAVICDIDIGMVSVDEAAHLRGLISEAVDTPQEAIRVSYTHTHAGPLARGDRRIGAGQELTSGYLESLRVQTVGAARAARLNAQPGRMAVGYGDSDIVINRRMKLADGRVVVGDNPEGFSDRSVLVVRFDDLSERPIAAVMGYAAHPTTLAFQNDKISPDYPGFARSMHESITGAPTLFLQGCAGNQMTRRGLTGDTAIPRNLGHRLAAASAKVFLGLRTVPSTRTFDRVVESGAPLGLCKEEPTDAGEVSLGVICEDVTMPARATGSVQDAEADVQRAIEALREAQRGSDTARVADRMYRAKRAEAGLRFAQWLDGREEAVTELQTIRIGPLGLVGFPGEPFAEIGHAVRTGSDLPFVHMGGYANGWRGYVPTDEAFAEGGYEVEIGSTFAPGAADALTSSALDQLRRVQGE